MKPFITWTLLAVCLSPAHATSIVALIQPNRILLAADSRRRATGIANDTEAEATCKIFMMNDGAFAINGLPRLRTPGDNPIVWDGPALGREVYAKHKGNALDAANEWADRGKTIFTSFLSSAAIVYDNPLKHIRGSVADYLVAGFSHNPDKPQLVSASIGVDVLGAPGRQTQQSVVSFPLRTEPYSSNPTTRELIAGQTERAKATLAAWQLKVTTIKESDRDLRYLEYLIQQTAEYDSSVNRTVNILEITAKKKPHWLQHPTCP